MQHNGTLLSHKKEWNNAICSNMDGPRYYHTKQSKSERERQISSDITHIYNLKYKTKELNSKTETESETEQTCGCWWGGGGRIGSLRLVELNYYIQGR